MLFFPYKGKTVDAGAFYAPYIPLQVGNTKLWERMGLDMPSDKMVYSVKNHEIWQWIEAHPIHMWKHYDIPLDELMNSSISDFTGNTYIFTDEMEAWFLLRWS